MLDIKPFAGLRYDLSRVRLADVVAPPYDVISPVQQEELYRRDPHNVVRLILGREPDRYREAAMHLNSWRAAGILRRDSEPGFYVLAQTFRGGDGVSHLRSGVIAAVRLVEFDRGVILPHEKTLSRPKEDRFRLMQATQTNLSQIFGLVSDPERQGDALLKEVMGRAPLLKVEFEGVLNQLWAVTDREMIDSLSGIMRTKSVLIADGHHRYETALAYRDLMRLKNAPSDGNEPFQYTMMFLTNMHSEGLVILPTHRLVHHLQGFEEGLFIKRLEEAFDVRPAGTTSELLHLLSAHEPHSYGVVLSGGMYCVHLKRAEGLAHMVGAHVPPEVRELDVTVLHSVIFEGILSIGREAQEKKLNLDYIKEVEDVVRAVREGTGQAGFLMNATRIEQVRRVAHMGHTMPQKSTFFYPKLLSGLVMNPLS
jgi:uncharacterized protein (DUF1015 family)